jgi:hypothetical protein
MDEDRTGPVHMAPGQRHTGDRPHRSGEGEDPERITGIRVGLDGEQDTPVSSDPTPDTVAVKLAVSSRKRATSSGSSATPTPVTLICAVALTVASAELVAVKV